MPNKNPAATIIHLLLEVLLFGQVGALVHVEAGKRKETSQSVSSPALGLLKI